MTGLTRVAPDAAPAEVAEILEREGAVIVEDFADPATLANLWHDLGPHLEASDYCESGYDGHRTRRVSSLFARTTHLTPVVTHPLYLGPARMLLQKPVPIWIGRARIEMTPNIHISASQAIQIDPGQGKQPLHREDTLYLRPHPGPTIRVQLMLAMTEFTAENGATLVIPGSHHWDDERPPSYAESVPAEMSAGSALIFLGGVYHGGGKNSTDRPRVGLTLSLDVANLRQEENQYLAVPREAVLAYPEEVRRLLGYDRCPPGVGWFELQDPYLVLEHATIDEARAAADRMGLGVRRPPTAAT